MRRGKERGWNRIKESLLWKRRDCSRSCNEQFKIYDEGRVEVARSKPEHEKQSWDYLQKVKDSLLHASDNFLVHQEKKNTNFQTKFKSAMINIICKAALWELISFEERRPLFLRNSTEDFFYFCGNFMKGIKMFSGVDPNFFNIYALTLNVIKKINETFSFIIPKLNNLSLSFSFPFNAGASAICFSVVFLHFFLILVNYNKIYYKYYIKIYI